MLALQTCSNEDPRLTFTTLRARSYCGNPSINKYIFDQWQTPWNNSIGNNPTISELEEVVLDGIRLSHTRITHSYLLLGGSSHNVLVVMHHLLYVTPFFSQVRNKCFHVDNMKRLVQDIHIHSIMTCFKRKESF